MKRERRKLTLPSGTFAPRYPLPGLQESARAVTRRGSMRAGRRGRRGLRKKRGGGAWAGRNYERAGRGDATPAQGRRKRTWAVARRGEACAGTSRALGEEGAEPGGGRPSEGVAGARSGKACARSSRVQVSLRPLPRCVSSGRKNDSFLSSGAASLPAYFTVSNNFTAKSREAEAFRGSGNWDLGLWGRGGSRNIF